MRLIAEIGWNHLGDMSLLQKMIAAAKESGATHAKLQIWKESRLKKGPWDSDGRRQLYRSAELSEDQLRTVKNYCDQIGIRFLTSIFDWRDIDLVANISNSEVKIPSPEICNEKLLRGVAKSFKLVYLSTGASTEVEIQKALDLLLLEGAEVILMHCMSLYPCPDKYINLRRLEHLKKKHNLIGYSDHSPDILSAVFAISMGVEAIEKHFTIDRELPGRDNRFAILPSALASLADAVQRYEQMSKDWGIDYIPLEREVRKFYRGRWCA